MMVDTIKKIYSINSDKIYNKTDFNNNEVGSEGYGETGFYSIESLVSYYKEYFNNETVFYDLGSGIGKIVYHIGIEYKPKKACGIEFSKERYLVSEKIKDDFKITNDNIFFINENILNCDLSDATVIYIDNTLFPTRIDKLIYDKIPSGCLVITRKMLRQSKLNNEIIKNGFTMMSDYGTNTIYTFKKQ